MGNNMSIKMAYFLGVSLKSAIKIRVNQWFNQIARKYPYLNITINNTIMGRIEQGRSSNIEFIMYHKPSENLFVKFHSGDTYRYEDVPLDEAEGLRKAMSQGGYLWENIARDQYRYEVVSGL